MTQNFVFNKSTPNYICVMSINCEEERLTQCCQVGAVLSVVRRSTSVTSQNPLLHYFVFSKLYTKVPAL